jgi:hypothetical protein
MIAWNVIMDTVGGIISLHLDFTEVGGPHTPEKQHTGEVGKVGLQARISLWLLLFLTLLNLDLIQHIRNILCLGFGKLIDLETNRMRKMQDASEFLYLFA